MFGFKLLELVLPNGLAILLVADLNLRVIVERLLKIRFWVSLCIQKMSQMTERRMGII
jgi:hypothetical protein